MEDSVLLEHAPSWQDVLLALFPPAEWSVIILIALATFAVTLLLKVVFKLSMDGDGLTPRTLRIFAAASAFPIAWGLWPVKQVPAVLAIALIGWLLAHILNKYGGRVFMRVFRTVAPTWYRRFNAEPDHRFENRGPRKGQTERRKPS